MHLVLEVQQRNDPMLSHTPEPDTSVSGYTFAQPDAVGANDSGSATATQGRLDRPAMSSQRLNNGARGRRERPCDACRRRKSRCVMNEGALVCVLCDFHHQECTFVQSPQPRKRKMPIQNTEPPPARGSVSSNVGSQPRMSPNSAPPNGILSSATGPTDPLEGAPELQPRTVAPPPFEGESLGLQKSKTSRYFGFTTPHDPLLLSFTTFTKGDEAVFPAIGTLRRVGEHTCFVMQPDEGMPDSGTSGVSSISAELRLNYELESLVHPYGITGNRAILNIYFRVVHHQFPIIHKKLFFSMIDSKEIMASPPLVAAMYLISLTWWNNPTYNPEFFSQPCPNSDALKSIALRALSLAMNRPRLSTIQAGLLVLQKLELSGLTAASGLSVPLPPGNPGEPTAKAAVNQAGFDGWLLSTQLIAIGQELGLHLDCTSWNIPSWEKGVRKKIAWALYMQDKWSCLIYGRPSHILQSDWVVPDLTSEDFKEREEAFVLGDDIVVTGNSVVADANAGYRPVNGDGGLNLSLDSIDDEESAKGQCVFVEMIKLTTIMSDILELFYSQVAIRMLRIPGPEQVMHVLDRAKPVQIRLKEWYKSLPSIVRMDNVKADVFSSTGSLHLAYFATEITLHRRIVQSLSIAVATEREGGPAGTVPPTPPQLGKCTRSQSGGTMTIASIADPFITHICRAAAKTRLISALDFANRLKKEHLQAFWHFASSINFGLIAAFGCLLWATSPTFEEGEFYRARLTEFRWTLSVNRPKLSGPVSWLDAAIRILDANRAALETSLASKVPVAELEQKMGGMTGQNCGALSQGNSYFGSACGVGVSPSFTGTSDGHASSSVVGAPGAGRMAGATLGRGPYRWGAIPPFQSGFGGGAQAADPGTDGAEFGGYDGASNSGEDDDDGDDDDDDDDDEEAEEGDGTDSGDDGDDDDDDDGNFDGVDGDDEGNEGDDVVMGDQEGGREGEGGERGEGE